MSEGGVGAVEREALERARAAEVARRQAYYARLVQVAELERLGVAHATGDRSTPRLVQELWLVDAGEAKRLVAEAGDLTPQVSLHGEALPARYPNSSRVLADGRIGHGHVAIIRRTMTRLAHCDHLDVEELTEAERFLADKAGVLPPRALARVADALIAALDPDGVAPPEGEDRFDELEIVYRRNGSFALRGRFHDPVDAEMFAVVFDTLSTPCGPDDPRSRTARHAAALKDLVRDALGPGGLATDTDPAQAGRARPDTGSGAEQGLLPEPRHPESGSGPGSSGSGPVRSPGRPQVTITIDHRWLQQNIGHGTLGSGAFVDARTVRRWACDAEVIPTVLGSRSEPLDVGRMSRTVTEAIRRALNLRDGGCTFPGCDRTPRRCQAHHVDPHWIDGGHTSLHNSALLCLFHHQVIHYGNWTIRMVHGRPWFTPPSWIDPERRPRPGGRQPVPT